jgi:hypothetical protein
LKTIHGSEIIAFWNVENHQNESSLSVFSAKSSWNSGILKI